MSSSNSGVLRQPFLATDPHVMGSAEAGFLDPTFLKHIDEARSSGYDQGFADGAKAAEAAARRSAEAAEQRLRTATTDAVAHLASTTVDVVPQLLDVAIAIARNIVAEVPEQVSASLGDRIAAALTQIDDDQLTISVSPGDLGEVSAGFGTVPGLTVVPDETLGAGEALIDGVWAHADLTIPMAWAIVEEGLRG